MLEADLQMKKDFSNYGNPCANEIGEIVSNLLDNKRISLVQHCMDKFPGEIKDINNIRFNSVTRNWIIPDKIYVYTNGTQIYIINSTLTINSDPVENYTSFEIKDQDFKTLSKGCLEELNNSAKEYGKYDGELQDRMIQPYIVAEINSGDKYRDLREVYTALALAQWYKSNIPSRMDIFRGDISTSNSTELGINNLWSPKEIWNAYTSSFKNGEYTCWKNETIGTATGTLIISNSLSAGGVSFENIMPNIIQINELPPEVNDLVKKAVIDGVINAGNDVFFGNRIHVDFEPDAPVLESFSQVDRELAISWYNKGVNLQDKGEPDEAILAYEEAVRLDPELIEAWYNKGVALYNQGKYDEATEAFDEATRLNLIKPNSENYPTPRWESNTTPMLANIKEEPENSDILDIPTHVKEAVITTNKGLVYNITNLEAKYAAEGSINIFKPSDITRNLSIDLTMIEDDGLRH